MVIRTREFQEMADSRGKWNIEDHLQEGITTVMITITDPDTCPEIFQKEKAEFLMNTDTDVVKVHPEEVPDQEEAFEEASEEDLQDIDLSLMKERVVEDNGKCIKEAHQELKEVQEMILKDLNVLATTLATDNSAWTRLETNQSKSSITVLPIRLKKRGTRESSNETSETDLLKSKQVTDEL